MKGVVRKIFISLFVLFALILTWLVLIPATAFDQPAEVIYIRTGQQHLTELMDTLRAKHILKNPALFESLGQHFGLDKQLRPGKYEIKKGASLVSLIRIFRNGRQAPVKLVITKYRTKKQLAGFLSTKCESTEEDFMRFLNDQESINEIGFDTNTIMAVVMPETYEIYWSNTPQTIFSKFKGQYTRYWNEERLKKASDQFLTATQTIVLASIIEEETNAKDEKPLIASVYLNRFRKGMRLQADPTVKFALNDFSIKRIYEKHLLTASPYNTYRNEGLPPGPICTPSIESVEAVLNAPKNDYLYFVAKSDFSGKHVFSATYEEHLQHAKAFQAAQDKQERIKAQKVQEEAL